MKCQSQIVLRCARGSIFHPAARASPYFNPTNKLREESRLENGNRVPRAECPGLQNASSLKTRQGEPRSIIHGNAPRLDEELWPSPLSQDTVAFAFASNTLDADSPLCMHLYSETQVLVNISNCVTRKLRVTTRERWLRKERISHFSISSFESQCRFALCDAKRTQWLNGKSRATCCPVYNQMI